MNNIPLGIDNLAIQITKGMLQNRFEEINLNLNENCYPKKVWQYPAIKLREMTNFSQKSIIKNDNKNIYYPINKFLSLKLHTGFKYTYELMEQFIKILIDCNSMFSFELFGNRQKINLILGLNEQYLNHAISCIKNIFTGMGITVIEDDIIKKILESKKISINTFSVNAPFYNRFTTYTDNFTIPPIKFLIDVISKSEYFCGIQVLFSKAEGFHEIIKVLSSVAYKAQHELSSLSMKHVQSPEEYLPEHAKNLIKKVNPDFPFIFLKLRTFAENIDTLKLINSYQSHFLFANKSLIYRNENDFPKNELKNSLISRKTYEFPMIGNLREFVSFLHFPNISTDEEKIPEALDTTSELPIPDKLQINNGLEMGLNTYDNETKILFVSDKNRKSLIATGSTGSGKSSFALNMMLNDAKNGYSFMMIDPDGSTSDDFLNRCPKSRKDDVILFDPSLKDWSIIWNFLITSKSISSGKFADDMTMSFKSIFHVSGSQFNWGGNIEYYIRNLLYLIHAAKGNLKDAMELLNKNNYKIEEYIKHIKGHSEAELFWKSYFPKLKTEIIAPTRTRISRLFLNPMSKRLFESKENRISFEKIFNENKILIVKLKASILGDYVTNIIGSLLFSLCNLEARRICLKTKFLVYIDEFHRFVSNSDALENTLTQGRKYNLFLRLFHQSRMQLNKELKDILSNCQLKVAFNVGQEDAEYYSNEFKKLVTPKQLLNLKHREYYIKINNLVTSARTCDLPVKCDETKKYIIKNSLEKYYQKVEEDTSVIKGGLKKRCIKKYKII